MNNEEKEEKPKSVVDLVKLKKKKRIEQKKKIQEKFEDWRLQDIERSASWGSAVGTIALLISIGTLIFVLWLYFKLKPLLDLLP